MKKITVIEYSNETALISSILFLIFGIILFTNPSGILNFISYIVGGILIVIGVFNILSYRKLLKILNVEYKSKLILGVILIIFGLFVILFSSLIEMTFRLICGGWIIYTGIIRLIETLNDKENKISFISRLIISILLIICGFYVALKTNLIFSTIGLFIIIYAILDIVGYIFYKKKF